MIKKVSIGEIFEFVRNGVPIKQEDNKTGYPITRIETIWNETIDDKRFGYADIFDKELTKYEKYLLQVGDILMTHINSPKHLGKCAMYNGIPEKLLHGMNLLCLRPNKEISDSKYLKHYLNSSHFRELLPRISNQSVNQASFSAGNLKSLEIPLPPLSQQQKIADILDFADVLRQKDKAVLAKYDELTQALFLDMFGDPMSNPKEWEKVKLGIVTKMKAGKFIAAKDIFSDNNNDLFSCYGGNGLRGFVKSFTHDGEFILIGRQGALCGNVKVANGKFHATEHAIVCSPIMKYQTLWLYYLLKILNLNRFATGAAQPGLNVGTLVDLEIIMVPYDLQNQFAERVAVIEKQKAIAQKSLEKSEELFNSLLQKAFKGELV